MDTLVSEVLKTLSDRSFSDNDVIDKFNECQFELAGEFLFPSLERSDDIDTNETNVEDLPDDYMRNLRACFDVTNNRKVKVYGSRVLLDRWFPTLDQTGRVLGVATYQDSSLYYQRIPSATTTLRINYFAVPTAITIDERPDLINWQLAKPLLKYYALKELFSTMEDGIDGGKVNTNHYSAQYMAARERLFLFLGPPQNEPVDFETEIDYDAYL